MVLLSSLLYQIESAQQQRYTDIEIGAAIIRATNSTTLRTVLEGKPGAKINDLLPTIKATSL